LSAKFLDSQGSPPGTIGPPNALGGGEFQILAQERKVHTVFIVLAGKAKVR
jgi:hypothetical protein